MKLCIIKEGVVVLHYSTKYKVQKLDLQWRRSKPKSQYKLMLHLIRFSMKFKVLKYRYSRTSIIRTPMCHFNVKGVQISEFIQINELSNKYTV